MSACRTTAALATAPARGGIAVIILAGPRTREILPRVFRPRRAWPERGQLALGWLFAPDSPHEIVDEAVLSFTDGAGRELAEINIHGGPHVARKVLTLLKDCGAEIACEGADAALAAAAGACQPDNPAMAAEMLSALRLAATPLAVAAVTAQWSGGLSLLARQALAAITGRGGDPSPGPGASARAVAEGAAPPTFPDCARRLRAAASALPRLRRLLHPAEVVIAGPPNAGKSALTNALVGHEVSIVSDIPGTTRDWVRQLTHADGVPIYLTDTAGLWSVPESIGAEAVRRAWQRIDSADLVICLIAGAPGDRPASGPGASEGDPGGPGLVRRLRRRANVVHVSGKCDVVPPAPGADLAVSSRTSAGIADLRRLICARLGLVDFDPSDAMAFTDRQERLCRLTADALDAGDLPAAECLLRRLLAGDELPVTGAR